MPRKNSIAYNSRYYNIFDFTFSRLMTKAYNTVGIANVFDKKVSGYTNKDLQNSRYY